MSTRSPGTIMVNTVVWLGVIYLIACVVANLVYTKRSDVPKAMVFHSTQLRNPIAHAGDDMLIVFTYSKRADCTPPAGSGDFYYKLYFKGPDGKFSRFYRIDVGIASLEEAGENLSGHHEVPIPKYVPPGTYHPQFMGRFLCKGENKAQTIDGDPLELMIVDRALPTDGVPSIRQ